MMVLVFGMTGFVLADDDSNETDVDDDDLNETDDDNDDEDEEDEDEIEIEIEEEFENGSGKYKRKVKIKARNRLGINQSQIPENCTLTGSVLKCDIGEILETKVEVEGNVDLSQEASTTLEELVASVNGSEYGKIEIEIEIEKDDDEIEIESDVEGTLNSQQQTLLDDLIAQLTELVENVEGDAEIEIEIKHRFKKKRVMAIFAGKSGNIIIKVKGINMTTNMKLYHHTGKVNGMGDNVSTLINYFPDDIREIIRNRVHADAEYEDEIELDEEGLYRVKTKKKSRLFYLVPVREKVRAQVDPETGEIIKIRNPWWGFLAKDVVDDDYSEDDEEENNESE